MPIPNPRNNYVPGKEEMVRVIGACHPRMLGKIARVLDVHDNWAEIEYEDDRHGRVITGGELGGLQPANWPYSDDVQEGQP
jgi:hypothetical protein